MAIRDAVIAAPVKDRARLKGEQIALLQPRRVAREGSFDIEVLELRPVEDGVELLVKAWDRGGVQIAFGDGTVEIERMRIFNPPILVPDPAGTIERTHVEDDGTVQVRRFREDLAEALLQVLEHNLLVIPRPTARIVQGKVGSTVSTFFAGPGDGWAEGFDAAWNGAHDLATANGGTDPTSTILRVMSAIFGAAFSLRRAWFPFDTSALPNGDDVSAATFSAWCTSQNGNGDPDGDDWFNIVGPTTQADPTTLVDADFDTCGAVDSPTEMSSDRKLYSAHTVGAYNNWILNAAGLALISKTAYTLIGMREGHDVLDSPYAGAVDTANQVRFSTSEETGTTQDPKLVVTHAAAPTMGYVRPNKLRPSIFAPGLAR
jgi:hypothetical protein